MGLGGVAKKLSKTRRIEMAIQALQQELNAKWEALPHIEDKEMIVALLRALVGDRSTEGLPNYAASIERMNEEIEARYGGKRVEDSDNAPEPSQA
jgi:hypothetical protein